MSDTELTKLFEGYGWHPMIVDGEDLDGELASALDTAHGEIRELQSAARAGNRPERPTWPMLIVRSPKGWTGIRELDGVRVEGTSKSHQVPAMQARSNPEHLTGARGVAALLRPRGAVRRGRRSGPGDRRDVPDRRAAHGRQPPRQRRAHARAAAAARAGRSRGRSCSSPADAVESSLGALGGYLGQVFELNRAEANFRVRVPGRGRLQPARSAVRGREPRLRVAGRPRDQPRLQARRAHHGGPLRAQLPGLAAGLRAHRPPRDLPLLRGVHPDRRRHGQPVRQVPEDVPRGGALARAGRVAELPAHLRGLAPGPQRLLPPDAGLHQLDAQPPRGARARVRAAGRQHAAGHDGPLPAGDRLHQPRDRLQAAAAAVAVDGGGPRARPRGSVGVEVG